MSTAQLLPGWPSKERNAFSSDSDGLNGLIAGVEHESEAQQCMPILQTVCQCTVVQIEVCI